MTGAEEAGLALGVGAVRGAVKITSQAVSTRGRMRLERARTERILSVITTLPPGSEWTETEADGTQWTVRVSRGLHASESVP